MKKGSAQVTNTELSHYTGYSPDLLEPPHTSGLQSPKTVSPLQQPGMIQQPSKLAELAKQVTLGASARGRTLTQATTQQEGGHQTPQRYKYNLQRNPKKGVNAAGALSMATAHVTAVPTTPTVVGSGGISASTAAVLKVVAATGHFLHRMDHVQHHANKCLP